MKLNSMVELLNDLKKEFIESSANFKISIAIVIYQAICFYNEHQYETIIENLIRAACIIPLLIILYKFIFQILDGYIDKINVEKHKELFEGNYLNYRKIEIELAMQKKEVSRKIAYTIFYIINFYSIFF
jgi:hypothetical protein